MTSVSWPVGQPVAHRDRFLSQIREFSLFMVCDHANGWQSVCKQCEDTCREQYQTSHKTAGFATPFHYKLLIDLANQDAKQAFTNGDTKSTVSMAYGYYLHKVEEDREALFELDPTDQAGVAAKTAYHASKYVAATETADLKAVDFMNLWYGRWKEITSFDEKSFTKPVNDMRDQVREKLNKINDDSLVGFWITEDERVMVLIDEDVKGHLNAANDEICTTIRHELGELSALVVCRFTSTNEEVSLDDGQRFFRL